MCNVLIGDPNKQSKPLVEPKRACSNCESTGKLVRCRVPSCRVLVCENCAVVVMYGTDARVCRDCADRLAMAADRLRQTGERI